MSTRRRARNPRASALVLGQPASAILHHGRTAHLIAHRSGDHRSRYAPGMRLSVKQMVPGPTDCHVILTAVRGPREEFTLGQITITEARALGHVRLDAFWRHWITNHDQEWLGRHVEAGTDTDQEIAGRFERRWSGKRAWLLRFYVDISAEPRLLAARSDELYVTNEAMALKGELPALTEAEWDTHVGPKSPYRIADRVAAKHALTWHARYQSARDEAVAKRKDIRSECRRFDMLIRDGKTEKAMRQLELIEGRLYPVAC